MAFAAGCRFRFLIKNIMGKLPKDGVSAAGAATKSLRLKYHILKINIHAKLPSAGAGARAEEEHFFADLGVPRQLLWRTLFLNSPAYFKNCDGFG